MKKPPDKPTPHGTTNGYNNYHCRCEGCRQAWATYYREHSSAPCANGCGRTVNGRWHAGRLCRACDAKKRSIPLEQQHGTETGYSKGCRCEQCREAANRARRNRPARKSGRDAEYLRERRRQSA